jgi:branched-chain amino acid aminotransferase
VIQEWVCLNGRLLPAEEARISVFDSGFMQGVGLFETMRVYRGRPFRLERHLDRLASSARKLGWSVIPEPEQTRDHVEQVLGPFAGQDARLRLTVTTGSLRITDRDVPELTIVASAAPGGKYPDDYYRKGVTLLVSRYRQSRHDPIAGHKTTSYFSRLASLREAHARGAAEALWLTDDEHVAEGAISTVFAVHADRLLTPPLETPVLPGITRATVIELAAELGIPVEERPLRLDELQSADEVFLTNSMMEVLPVVRIERTAIGTEKPGEITMQLAQAYRKLVEKECGHA